MGIESKIERLERATRDEGDEAHAERWRAAYVEIARTMSNDDFAEVHGQLLDWLAEGGGLDRSGLSFVAARVVSLVEQAANGLGPALLMPPALASAWREWDRELKDAAPAERFDGSFNFQACATCGAEHPWRGRFTPERRAIVNPEELIKTCLVCGGAVGNFAAQRPAPVVSAANN